jgi:hypothetical protein
MTSKDIQRDMELQTNILQQHTRQKVSVHIEEPSVEHTRFMAEEPTISQNNPHLWVSLLEMMGQSSEGAHTIVFVERKYIFSHSSTEGNEAPWNEPVAMEKCLTT